MTTFLQKTVAVAFAVMASFSAVADQKPILDVIIPSSNTGNSWKQGVMLNEALKKMGFDSEMVHTANCINNNDYIAKTDRPGFFFQSGSSYAANLGKNCKIDPTVETFVTPLFHRSQAMCTLKSNNFKSLEEFLKGKTRVTVANTSSLPDGLYNDLTAQYGVEFVRVDYKGSSRTLKGLLAGDVDLMYTGYTAREASNPDVHCFATTAGVNGTESFDNLFANWALKDLSEFAYVHGVKLDAQQTEQARIAIHEILATDPKMVEYYSQSHITTGDVLYKKGVSMPEWLADKNMWLGNTK